MMNVHELEVADRERFEREYWKWVEHACAHDWYEWTIDDIKRSMQDDYNVDVDNVWFSLAYSQGDYASFEGSAKLIHFMEALEIADDYPVLAAAAKASGSWITFTAKKNNVTTEVEHPNAFPSGLFQHLPTKDWDELVSAQFDEADIGTMSYDFAVGKCEAFYQRLRDEYEYLTSETAFKEWCDSMDETFEGEDDEVCSEDV
jgi:hypothetical protein